MTDAAPAARFPERLTVWFGAVLTVLTLVRIAALVVTPIGLHPDETQYWAWAQSLEWGYFSKPPLIAWTIAGSTALFGDDAWAVRLFAPLAHGVAAIALFALGRRMFGPWAGFWAGIGWLLMPGVWLSSALISTDALLLPLWSLALLAAWRLCERRSWADAVLLGLAVGFGALAKYAMVYFPVCVALAALTVPRACAAFLSPQGVLAAALGLAVLGPNLIWNAQHDFATVGHTVANANWGGELFNPEQLQNFLVDQLGVGGVLVIGLIMILLSFGAKRAPMDEHTRFLLCFIAPPLLVVMGQALISRAHGNWAAAAYPALVVLVAGKFSGLRFPWIMAGVHAAIYGLFLALTVTPGLIDRLGLANATKRIRGWDETAALVAARAEQWGPFTAVMVDHRHSFFELTYHWRDARPNAPLKMWVLREAAGNQAEAIAPMDAAFSGRVLIMHLSPHYNRLVRDDFTTFETVETITQNVGPGKQRIYALSVASGFNPKPRDRAFLEAVGE